MANVRLAVRPQLGLRLILLLVAFFCVTTAWQATRWKLAVLERERVTARFEHVKFIGGSATLDPSTNTVRRALVNSSKTKELRRRFRNNRIASLRIWLPDSTDMEELPRFEHIGHLQLNGPRRALPLFAADLAHLANCRGLHSLSMSNPLSNDALSSLESCRSLTTLSLMEIDVTEDTLVDIEKLTGLRHLNIKSDDLSTEAIARLTAALPNCQIDVQRTEPARFVGDGDLSSF